MIRRLVRTTATLFTGVAVLAAVAAAVGAVAGLRPQPVLSGSMEPGIPVGSLAIAKSVPATSVQVGDVITFARPNAPGQTITHRVTAIGERDGARVYRTKGDANRGEDPWALRLPGDVGAHVSTVPYLGYVALNAARPAVRGATLALLTVLLMLVVGRRLWRTDETSPAAAAPAPQPTFQATGHALHAGWQTERR